MMPDKGDKMASTEAQKRAVKKAQAKCDAIMLRPPKEEGQGVLSSGESWAEIDVEAQEKWMRSQGIETADMTAQEIREYQTGSWVFVRVGGRFVDAMEDFQLSVDNL